MPAFNVSGSTGQAPTASFFGAIPDMLNILYPGNEDVANGAIITTNQFTASNVKQWIPANLTYIGGSNTLTCSFGAATTAPDGSNNATHLTESTSNSKHWVTALGVTGIRGNDVYTMRLAVFAKAAERTRFVLGWRPALGGTSQSDMLKTVYDLANGVIAVTGSNINDTGNGYFLNNLRQGINPFGNGWYLCWLEFSLSYFTIAHSVAYIFLDNGSGNAAESTTYTGDGTSGVYFWRATALPPQAWAMTGKTEFSEYFNDPTMANFDLSDTRAPGFTWYTHGVWPVNYAGQIVASTSISVANSVLTMHDLGTNTVGIGTAAWTGGSGLAPWSAGTTYSTGTVVALDVAKGFYKSLQNGNIGNQPDISPTFWQLQNYTTVGRSFNLFPGFYECGALEGSTNCFASFWFNGVASYSVTGGGNVPVFSSAYLNTPFIEQDVFEQSAFLAFDTHCGLFYGYNSAEISSPKTSVGYSIWKSTATYSFNQRVVFNNIIYNMINGSNSTNNQPDVSPTFWQVLDPQSEDSTTAPTAGQNQWDPALFHKIAILNLPEYRDGNTYYPAQFWAFFDRLPNSQLVFGRNTSNAGETGFHRLAENVNVSSLDLVGSRGNSSLTKYDWCSVTR